MNPQMGRWLVFAGIAIISFGLFIYFFSEKIQWLGKLPGDFRWDIGKMKIYFPLATMLIVSLVLNIILYLIKKMR